MIQHQILRTSQQRNVWSSVGRIIFQILRVKGLIPIFTQVALHVFPNVLEGSFVEFSVLIGCYFLSDKFSSFKIFSIKSRYCTHYLFQLALWTRVMKLFFCFWFFF